ncbi:Rossmann-like domain-containing protein, partial [Chloroflexota bacterium]
FTPRLRNTVKELWVIEKNPREGDFTEAEGENLIPQADVVGITGTAFTNHTIEQLLKLCAEAYVVVLGDTAPLSPVLFDYGIDAISGTKVVDPDLALRCVSEGATYRQIEGILKLTMTAGGKETL